MTVEQLKIILEIANTGSLNKASENLYISQPNLSRALKSIESELGFTIFNRTNKGVIITIQGQEFLYHAKKIMSEIELIEEIGHPKTTNQEFSISVPKAQYITDTFRFLISHLNSKESLSIDYKETSPIGAINNILLHNFRLGIIRYQDEFNPLFELFLKESNLIKREICSFTYKIAVSKNSKLAAKESVKLSDLSDYIEITHGDNFIPGISNIEKKTNSGVTNKVIRVYDSMGQLQLLNKLNNTFMFVFPLDDNTLEKYNLVQIELSDYKPVLRDYLIYKNDYIGTKIDKIFCDQLTINARKI